MQNPNSPLQYLAIPREGKQKEILPADLYWKGGRGDLYIYKVEEWEGETPDEPQPQIPNKIKAKIASPSAKRTGESPIQSDLSESEPGPPVKKSKRAMKSQIFLSEFTLGRSYTEQEKQEKAELLRK